MHVNVSIVGLNRVSVSFALALKRYQNQPKAAHTFTIIGSDAKGQAMKSAHKMGALDNFDIKILKATENADLILLNSPFGQLAEVYALIGPTLKPGAVVLDMAELKQLPIEWARKHFPANAQGQPLAYLVGITPVVNVKGLYEADYSVDAATADLFEEAEILVAPDAKCPSEAITLAEDIIGLLGAKPRFTDPAEHDALVATTETLPSLLGASLFYMVRRSEGWSDLRRMINPSLALLFQNLRYQTLEDMRLLVGQNRENMLRHLESLIGVLDEVHDLLEENDPDKVEAFFARVGSEWEKWDIKRHSGKWEDVQHIEALPGPLGSMTNFLTLKRRPRNGEDEDK